MVDLNKIRIGVVIVNYNSGGYLSKCLKSLSTSTAPLEIVVVDNNSSDRSLVDSEGIIGAPNILKLVRNDENLGFSRAVNIGMGNLDNRFVMILNPDCTVFPSTMIKLQKVLVSNKQAAIAGAMVYNPEGSEQRGCRRNEPTLARSMVTALGLDRKFEGINLSFEPFPAEPEVVDAVSGAAMMVRRTHFDDVGGMDEDYFLHCEDLDICRKARDRGYDVLFCPGSGVIHHQGASSNVTTVTVERHKHDGMITYNRKHSNEGRFAGIVINLLVRGHFILGIIVSQVKKIAGSSRNDPVGDEPGTGEFNALELTSEDRPLVIVTGGKSDVGDFLLDMLEEKGFKCIAISRNEPPMDAANSRATWLNLEYFIKSSTDDMGEIHAWINLAPVWTTHTLAAVLHRFQPKMLVSVSSTSVEGKAASHNEADIKTVNKLVGGEKWVLHYAKKFKTDATILRPTLIYGGPRNHNINFIGTMIRRLRFFPMIGTGNGKRQPVHAEDLATLCVQVISKGGAGARTYNSAGGEVLTYRKMVDRVFSSLERQPRYLTVSLNFAKRLTTLASYLPGLRFLNAEMVQRIQQDLVYSNDDAIRDFQYAPRKFSP